MMRYINVLRDAEGNAVAGATIRVYVGDSTTLATVYDGAGNPVSQPLSTNDDGLIVNESTDPLDKLGFKAAAGRYRIEGEAGGQTVGPLPDILIGDAQGYDVGTGAGQVPTNADLGGMAYEDDADYYTKAETYSQSEVDALVSGPQVWEAVKTDTASTTSETWVDIADLSITLTPESVDDDFLVTLNAIGTGASETSGQGVPLFRLVRDDGTTETVLAQADAAGSRAQAHTSPGSGGGQGASLRSGSGQVVDTPGVTAAITYKVQWRRNGAGNTAVLNRSASDVDDAGHARAVSTLHVTRVRKQA